MEKYIVPVQFMLAALRFAPFTDGKHNIGIMRATYETATKPVAGKKNS